MIMISFVAMQNANFGTVAQGLDVSMWLLLLTCILVDNIKLQSVILHSKAKKPIRLKKQDNTCENT